MISNELEILENEDEQKLAALYLRIFKAEALPLFPTYFEKILEKRETNNDWNERSVWIDSFVPMVGRGVGQVEGTMTCLIPAPRVFWDTWLCVYQLENPDIFSHPSIAARVILREIQTVKLDVSGYGNLEPYHLDYLTDLANSKKPHTNMFLLDPFEAVVLLKLIPMVECARGVQDPIDFMQRNEEFQKEAEKCRTALEAEWRIKYPDFF